MEKFTLRNKGAIAASLIAFGFCGNSCSMKARRAAERAQGHFSPHVVSLEDGK